MKKKVVLMGAMAGFEGPKVLLEKGEWQLRWNEEAHEQVVVRFEVSGESKIFGLNGDPVHLTGPCYVGAAVCAEYQGPGIHIDAVRLSRA